MTRSPRRILLVGVAATVALVVVATLADTARIGPLVFWAVHRTADGRSSTVSLRPGLGLLLLWVAVLAATGIAFRRRDV